MPTYDYECTGCGQRFELRRSFAESGSASCPRCGCRAERIFTSVPIIFKGSGFYVTDYKNGTYSPPASDPGEANAPSTGDAKVSD